ncbi:MAG: Flp family type IVb pilin [Planctomycetota bacterium]|jgi:Flp pilus assembly pilin Flp
MKLLKRFIKDERGLEFSEYALLLALICLLIIAAITLLKNAIFNAFSEAADNMETT